MAGYVPLEIEQYATFSRIITIKTDAGIAQNLSGYTANTQMRKSYYSINATDIPTIVTDAANGEITMSMTAANSGLLVPGRYWYDMVTLSPGGVTQRLIEGVVVVSAGVTR